MSTLYRLFGRFGLATVFGVLLYGFRYDPTAPAYNALVNVGLFVAWAAAHLLMTTAPFKRAVYGDARGSPAERRVFITLAIATWTVLFAFHLPISGPALALPEWLRFVGLLGFILCVISFFEGTTFAMIDGLLGVPGSAMSHSHGAETPLLTEGSYAKVRHPMYRAATLACLCTLLIHPHAGSLLWGGMVAATFIVFIPIEERRLIAARGDAYRAYCRQTPYRLFHGVW